MLVTVAISLPRSILQGVGGITCLLLIYRVAYISSLWLLPIKPLTKYQRKHRTWALITGSSGGIGYACARELAARGFHLILLAHVREELDAAQKRIQNEFPSMDIITHVCNVTTATNNDIAALAKSMSSLPLTILINNVGGIATEPPRLCDSSEFSANELDGTINLNARFMSQLTLALLPQLRANGPSLILNLSSGGKYGFPGLTMYSATKAFVSIFSKSLAREAKAFDWPIDVLSVAPGDTYSQNNNVGLIAGSPTARQLAEKLMDLTPRAIERRMLEVSPWFMHTVQTIATEWLPERVVIKAALDMYEKKKRGHDEAAKGR